MIAIHRLLYPHYRLFKKRSETSLVCDRKRFVPIDPSEQHAAAPRAPAARARRPPCGGSRTMPAVGRFVSAPNHVSHLISPRSTGEPLACAPYLNGAQIYNYIAPAPQFLIADQIENMTLMLAGLVAPSQPVCADLALRFICSNAFPPCVIVNDTAGEGALSRFCISSLC